MDTSGLRWPKGETRKTRKARRDRRARAVVGDVRSQCVGRDGYCRLYVAAQALRARLFGLFGGCRGASQWSHYNATHRRSKTMGMDPEQRHDRRHSLMLCAFHAAEYDQNRMAIDELTDDGCDGRLLFERGGAVWKE